MTNPNDPPTVERLQTLLEAARLLNSTLELKELAEIILEVIRAEVPVDRVTVFVVDQAHGRVRSLVAQQLDNFEISLPIGSGIAGTVAATGDVLDVPDAYADARFDRGFDVRFKYHTKDMLALPVCNRRGEIVGVLQLLNRVRPISDADLEFLLGISVFIGLALENASLHARLTAKEKGEDEADKGPQPGPWEGWRELDLRRRRPDIRNPLAFAVGFAELAGEQEDLPPDVQEYLHGMNPGMDLTAQAARHVVQLVEEQKNHRVLMDLPRTLRNISQLRAEQWQKDHIEAALLLESAPPVLAHEGQLQLVLNYLLSTAEMALLQLRGHRRLRICLTNVKGDVQIDITAKGNSMGGKPPAPGLGLAIAASIIEQHNGRLDHDLDPGGLTYILRLPDVGP